MKLFIIKDGIKGVAFLKDEKGNQILGTNYYSISFDFKSNEGYIAKKRNELWRLYTQIGQKLGQSRYHDFSTFNMCIEKLIELKGDKEIIICDSTEIEKYKGK